MMKTISIVIPAYNEEANLERVYDCVTDVFDNHLTAYHLEAIILDNCSTDNTESISRELCIKDKRWKYIRYSRNYGFDASISAGIDHANGDAVITLLSDLQDPPELIPEMVHAWEDGAEIVNGIVRIRNDSSLIKTLGAKLSYKLIYLLSESKIPEGATDFRLLDRKVVLALRTMREQDRYLRGMVNWVGFKRTHIPYDRIPRARGQSNAGLWYCAKYALSAIVSYSAKPLRLATLFGLFVTMLSVALAVLYITVYVLKPDFVPLPPPGISTLIILILFGIGTQTVFLGLIGEYVARIYTQSKNRPLYIVSDSIGFDSNG
ncbi:MAG: glycosyltransferase family 2 protein [Opitutales bacterium]|nr:glycosyltransferase family 2 protein [Opitutales bacterium]